MDRYNVRLMVGLTCDCYTLCFVTIFVATLPKRFSAVIYTEKVNYCVGDPPNL